MSTDNILPGEAPYKNRKIAAKERERDPYAPTKEEWDSLVTVTCHQTEVRKAVNDNDWQRFRVHLLGMSHSYRYHALYKYLHELDEVQLPLLHTPEEWEVRKQLRRVRVANYVNALRRGGLIP